MGTATGVAVEINERSQFQGIFDTVRMVEFTVDVGSIGTNSIDATIVSVPGLTAMMDIVLGWTHTHDTPHNHELLESIHAWDDELHLVVHNTSGGPIDPPSTTYRVIVGHLART